MLTCLKTKLKTSPHFYILSCHLYLQFSNHTFNVILVWQEKYITPLDLCSLCSTTVFHMASFFSSSIICTKRKCCTLTTEKIVEQRLCAVSKRRTDNMHICNLKTASLNFTVCRLKNKKHLGSLSKLIISFSTPKVIVKAEVVRWEKGFSFNFSYIGCLPSPQCNINF